MPMIIEGELERRVLAECAVVLLVCNACGWQTERNAPSKEDIDAYMTVQELREARHELSLLRKAQALFDRFPDSLHPIRVDRLGLKLPDRSEGKPDPAFDAAMESARRDDPEFAEWLWPSQGIKGFSVPRGVKRAGELIALWEEQLRQCPVVRCPSCEQTALEVPPAFIEEARIASRRRQAVEAERLKGCGFPYFGDVYDAPDPSVYFTDANDHNPIVLGDCHGCRGKGCSWCEGTGVRLGRGPFRFFSNDAVPMDTDMSDQGWAICPACSERFHVSDPYAWTGRRHRGDMHCGQRIFLRAGS